jgi:amino acid adenylation domain-containing protein/non-ribosomal peptide synthase protein (TIGR01720 family)
MSEQKRIRRRERGGALTEEQQQKLQAKLADSQISAQKKQLDVRQDRLAKVPVTPAQQRLWTAWQLAPEDSVYNLAGTLTFQGKLNKAWVKAGFAYLVAKHGILNSRFREEAGQAIQQLESDNGFTFIDVATQADIAEQAFAIADQPFNLSKEPLLRVAVLEAQDKCTLLVVMHHIVTDGTSMQQLFNEFIQAYALLQNQQSLPQIEAKADYLDYALWFAKQDQTALLEKQLTDWQAALGDDFEPLRLPVNNLARQGGNYSISTQSLQLPAAVWQQIQALTKSYQVTPYLVLLSAFEYLLHRYSNQTDIKIGVPVANRHHAQAHGLIGFFINTQVMRLEVEPQDSFASLLNKTKLFSLFAHTNQDLPFEHLLDVVKAPRSAGTHPLFQVMFNYLKRDKRAMDSLQGVSLVDTQALRFSMPFDLQLDVIEEATAGTTLYLYYANSLYSETFAKHCLDELAALLSGVSAHPTSPLQYLNWYPKNRQQCLALFSKGEDAFVWRNSITDIISEQATKTPHQSALVFAGEHMNYAEFEQRTNQLANWLIAQGIGTEEQIGVYFERSFEMVIALIGVMKSGAAYVPLDPHLPAERVNYIAQNSTFKLVLGNLDSGQFDVPYFTWATLEITLRKQSYNYPRVSISPLQAAYVIYTSGSTGKPKGVINNHLALYNRISWQDKAYPIDEQDNVLQKTPYGFDVSVWEFFWPLMRGATLVVAEPEIHTEPQQLAALIQAQNVTLLHFVPSMLQAFINEPLAGKCQSIRHMICSGEALPAMLQADALKLFPKLAIHNLYGPTEAAIDVSYYECDGCADSAVPIGSPIAGCELLVLDQQLNLSPIGAVGELYIGGVGLARGYANRPDLSAERFVANPFAIDGSRLYRSGDLVRWNEQGELEYLGRTDHQIKIRGLRIELGEIETQLFAQSGVKEAVVVAIAGINGSARLAAYVSGESLVESQLQQRLSNILPDYMVPSVVIVLDTLPLNSNGKVDRKALLEPVTQVKTSYQAPQGLREELLCQTWQRVLGHPQISRDDNFFALGGDSILSLQIVAAMRQHGYALSAKQLFDAPTIAQLSSQLSDLKDDDMAAQIVSGDVPLLPIQHTYFARQPAKLSHWNQAIRLTLPTPIGFAELAQSLQALIKHHDSLRLQYTQQGVWHQAYREYDEVDYREALWYQKSTDCEFNTYLTQAAEQAQASLNITRGDNIRVVYVQSETHQQLILIAHHLVIDGVSWRILIDDLVQGIEQTVSGSIISLTPKSHSYQYWAQQLQAYPSTYADEFEMWDSQQSAALVLPNFVAGGDDTMQSAQTLQCELTEAQTHVLLSQAQRPYRTQIDELLLAALSVALEKWTGANEVQVFIEGHGREPWQPRLDLSRTLGWFTALYPIKLTRFMDIADTIIATKERLRGLPNKGIGYGAFKYYGNEAQQQALKTQCKPQIEFNYLGQLDASSNAQFADWQMSTDGVGSSIAAENPLSADIAINCAVQNGQLQLSITYSSACLLQADMADFTHLLEQAIGDVIDHCTDAQVRFTPADVPLLAMSQVELDELPISQPLVSSIYPLTAMQQGMMFHSMAEQSAAYLNQLRLDITGLDVARFKVAWQLVVERHDALRSGFISASKEPLQYVVKDHQITFTELNWQSSSEQATDALAKALLDKGFVVTEQVGLMSFTLVQLTAAEHHFIWTYHHMLLDGWSSTAVLAEVMMAYQEQALAVPEGQFKDYLSYLANQNIAASDKYWQGRLEQLRDATYLTELQSSVNEPSEHDYAKYALQLNEQQAEQLQTFAQQQQITVNTILQGAWSLLLGRMLNKSVVCFGATTSGRPADLVGSDHTVGLFINTLPVISTLDNEKTVGQWLKERQQDSMASREFEHTPLNQIQKLAEGLVSFNHQGLFDSLLIFENYPVSDTLGAADFNGTRFNLVENREETNYPLTVFVETAQGLTINFAYQGWRLSEERVAQLASNLDRLLGALQAHVEKPLSQIQLLDDNAQSAIAKLGRGQSEVLPEKSVLALFEECAEQTPNALAVRNEYAEYITYAELNHRANQLAHALIARGVATETPIVVSMTRGIEMILTILAVNKAGGVYVPIALELPSERRDYIFKHSGAKLVLTNTNSHFADDITSLNITEIVLDSYSDNNPNNVRHHDQLVYTLYTSGSTGLPKGVAINHGNLLNFLLGMQKRLGLEGTLNALALTSLSFDISGLEIYLPLISGGTVTVANDTTALTPTLLSEQDLLQATPAGWRSLLALNLLTDVEGTLALCGGEALPAELVGELAKTGVALWNMYGPTETTIWSSCYHVEQPLVHLGDAILNTQLYVLDNQLNLCPQMVVGELYIAGAGLARGYLSRPDLSAERFVANPFSDDGSRLYRSGDLVRWNDQDQLEYLGRTDHQVKVRGYRIELGDIEAQLYRCDGVKEAVVIDDNSTESTQLVGYVSGEQLDAEVVKVSISQWLPDYMVPALITVLDDIPHNSNGKIDRNALPKPQWQAPRVFEAAQTEIECHLAAIWQTVLGAEQVGRHDNFFALGGDSISSLRVIALAKKYDLFVPVDALFKSANLAQLAARLEAMPMEVIDIPRLAIPYTGLSYAQQRQWLLWKLDPSSAAYHITGVLRLTGDLDLTAVEQALTYVMQRHDSLRTHFSETAQGDVLQQISVSTDLPLVQHDVTAGHSASWDALFTEVFDLLGNKPLVRFGLFKYSENSYELGVVLHHIIADGWSVKLLIDDFVAAYEAIKQGDVLQVGLPELRYSDYAKWQQIRLNDGEEGRQLAYWQDKLGTDHSVLGLPYDKTFSADDKRSANHEWILPGQLKGQLSHVAQQQGCTLFSVLMAAWQVVLHRFSGESHIKVGMPTANRQYSGSDNVVGMFVNTQVIANKLNGAQSLLEVVTEVAQTLTEAQANQDLPFEKLVDALDVPRDSHSTPIFQVMMNHQQISEDKLSQLSGLEFEVMQAPRLEAQLDLTLNSFEDAFGTLNISIEYFAARFSAARVKTLGDAFSYVLSMCADRPNMLVSELELLTSDTQKQLISKGCGKTCSFKQSVLLQFEEAVHQNMDAVVLRHGDTDVRYGELDARSNQLANYLIAQGVQAEDNVGLVFSRGIDMIVSMLAVLKAGAVYVPLAPSLPTERVAYICEHSELVYALCNTEHSLPEHVHVWSLNDGLTKHSTTAPDINISSEQLAYVLYTSGSTGKPKGVAISHGSLSNFVASMAETFDSNDSHAWLALTSLSFDISGLEIYLPLLHGSTLVIADSVMDVDSDLISQVTHVQATPAGWRSLLAQEVLDQPLVGLCGGEALPESLAQALKAQQVHLFNMYGPTETTIWSSCHEVCDSIHLGEAISNTQLYVLDNALNLCPPLVQGELYIAGGGLARGYLARPDLTAERFVANPFDEIGSRLYRTGDNVRWNGEGELEYLGRIDHQVKVRGFRIELGEIEAVLDSHASVRAAVVVADTGPNGMRLVGYVESDIVEQAELNALLASKLPEYMLPSVIVVLAALPLNTSGKVDRKALPKTEAQTQEFMAPETKLESKLAEIWQMVLGADQVGRHDNFFALGGDSITALRLVSRINQLGEYSAVIKDIFSTADLAALAVCIAESWQGIKRLPLERTVRTEVMPASPTQQSLWLTERLSHETDKAAYNIAGGVSLSGILDLAALKKAFNMLIVRHEILRTCFVDIDGEPSVEFQDSIEFELPIEHIDCETQAQQVRSQFEQNSFDLRMAPLMRAKVLKLSEQHYQLLVSMHHIVSDGWSVANLVHELGVFYAEQMGDTHLVDSLVPLEVQYMDYAIWQNARLESEEGAENKAFWQEQLKAAPPISLLPLHLPRSDKSSNKGEQIVFNVASEVSAQLQVLSETYQLSLFALLKASYLVFLSQQTGQQDLVIGTDLAGREEAALEPLIGFFIKVLPVRVILNTGDSFLILAKQIQQQLLAVQDHQLLTLEGITQMAGVQRQKGVSPIFQQLFVMQNTPQPRWPVDGVEISELPNDIVSSKFDSAIFIAATEQALSGSMVFKSDLYVKDKMRTLINEWLELLAILVAQPQRTLTKVKRNRGMKKDKFSKLKK